MPKPVVPPMDNASTFIIDAFIAAILSFSISISLADIYARKHRYTLDFNQVSIFFKGGYHI